MLLSGSDLAGFIKQRHYEQVRSLRAKPKMVILQAGTDPVTASFVRAKMRYGGDIGVIVEHRQLKAATTATIIEELRGLGEQEEVGGVVVQLPLPEGVDIEKVLSAIEPQQDIDGLGPKSKYDSATATAIIWILGSYDVPVKDQSVVVIGQGRLVGQPVARLLEEAGAKVTVCNDETKDLAANTKAASVIISGTGQAGLITRDMVSAGSVIIDAGTSEAGVKIAGDVDPELYDDPDIRVTPTPGGVGPMTVAVLFENLLRGGVKE